MKRIQKILCVGLVMVIPLLALAQTSTFQFGLNYNNGLVSFTRSYNQSVTTANPYELSSASLAVTGGFNISLISTPPGGYLIVRNISTNGAIQISAEGTNWVWQLNPGDFGMYRINQSNWWVRSGSNFISGGVTNITTNGVGFAYDQLGP